MNVFTAQQMRDFDKAATEQYGIPSIVLMENAALRVVEFLEAKFAPLAGKKVAILCGKGNNGGDGLAVARHLEKSGCRIHIFLACKTSEFKGDAAIQWKAIQSSLFEPTFLVNEIESADDFEGFEPDIVLDALLGTGFKGEIEDEALLLAIDYMEAAECPCVAIDIPSGLNADSGEADESLDGIIDYTVTFAAPKRGFFVGRGPSMCGEIWVGDIGTPVGQNLATTTGVAISGSELADYYFPHRSVDAHKGDAGRALIVGGSVGMSGAVALACRSALASGVGLCITALPEKILPAFAASILEATSHPLPCDESGKLVERAADDLHPLWKGVNVVAIGPGVGRTEETQKFVQRVVRECPVPLIIDADALHALPSIAGEVSQREAATILTPHPGEMGTLMGITAKEVNAARYDVALECAQKYNATVVLKGVNSLVADPGGEIHVNLSGNSGMATGGSGDVLTGTIAGIMAQTELPDYATPFAVYLHGKAGDLAYKEKSIGLLAGDIAAHLGEALVAIPLGEIESINGRLKRLM